MVSVHPAGVQLFVSGWMVRMRNKKRKRCTNSWLQRVSKCPGANSTRSCSLKCWVTGRWWPQIPTKVRNTMTGPMRVHRGVFLQKVLLRTNQPYPFRDTSMIVCVGIERTWAQTCTQILEVLFFFLFLANLKLFGSINQNLWGVAQESLCALVSPSAKLG